MEEAECLGVKPNSKGMNLSTCKSMNQFEEIQKIVVAADAVSQNKQERLDKMLKMVESVINEGSKQHILNILEQVSLLNGPERLLLYLQLPGGTSPVDPLRQPPNPLGSRCEIGNTAAWIRTHLEVDPHVSLPKQDVYDEYMVYCSTVGFKPLSTADFGKVMKQVFPNLRPRRLGTRGHSRYCYAAMRKARGLASPMLPDLDTQVSTEPSVASFIESWNVVRPWAEKLLQHNFPTIDSLATYINTSLSTTTDVAKDITSHRKSQTREQRDSKKRPPPSLPPRSPRCKKLRGNQRSRESELPSNIPISCPLSDISSYGNNYQTNPIKLEALPVVGSSTEADMLSCREADPTATNPPLLNPLTELQGISILPTLPDLPLNYNSTNSVPLDLANKITPAVNNNLLNEQIHIKVESKCTKNDMLPMNLSTDHLAGTNASCDADIKFNLDDFRDTVRKSSDLYDVALDSSGSVIKRKNNRKCGKRTRTVSRRCADEFADDKNNTNTQTQLNTLSNKLPLPRLPNKIVSSPSAPSLMFYPQQNSPKYKHIQPRPASSEIIIKTEPPGVQICDNIVNVSTLKLNGDLCADMKHNVSSICSNMRSPAMVTKDQEFGSSSKKGKFVKGKYRPLVQKPETVTQDRRKDMCKGADSGNKGQNVGNLTEIDIKMEGMNALGILPRERVISICNLDKDALDGYLHGGDNSQEQEEELLQYFPRGVHDNTRDELKTTVNNKISEQSKMPLDILEKPTSAVVKEEPIGLNPEYHEDIRHGNNEQISQLRMLLQKNIKCSDEATNIPQIPNMNMESHTAHIKRYIQSVQETHLDPHQISASASLALLSHNHITKTSQIPLFRMQALNPRRRVSFEPLPHLDIVQSVETIPQSPNTRRRNFSFQPISPGPLSPISKGIPKSSSPKCSSATDGSPFVSPRNTPVPRTRQGVHIKPIPKTRKNHPVTMSLGQPQTTASVKQVGSKFTAFSKPVCPTLYPCTPTDTCGTEVSRFFSESAMNSNGFRSQSVPLHIKSLPSPTHSPLLFTQQQMPLSNRQYTSYNNSANSSVAATPIPNEFSDFEVTYPINVNPELGILNDALNFNDSLTLPLLETDSSNADLYSTVRMNEILPQNPEFMTSYFDSSSLKRSSSIDFQKFSNDNNNKTITSRSVPSTPQPLKMAALPQMYNTQYEFISKSVPCTPIRDGCFRYSPTYNNRDFLINGNSVDSFKTDFSNDLLGQNDAVLTELEQRETSLEMACITEDLTNFTENGLLNDDIIMSDLTTDL